MLYSRFDCPAKLGSGIGHSGPLTENTLISRGALLLGLRNRWLRGIITSSLNVDSGGQIVDIVIYTEGYGTMEGHVAEITLPGGKRYYTGVSSIVAAAAKDRGWECRVVPFFGACIAVNLVDRAHTGFPIQVDGVSVADFVDEIATDEEFKSAAQGFWA